MSCRFLFLLFGEKKKKYLLIENEYLWSEGLRIIEQNDVYLTKTYNSYSPLTHIQLEIMIGSRDYV